MQHFEKLLSPSEYDRQLEPNCPIDFETKQMVSKFRFPRLCQWPKNVMIFEENRTLGHVSQRDFYDASWWVLVLVWQILLQEIIRKLLEVSSPESELKMELRKHCRKRTQMTVSPNTITIIYTRKIALNWHFRSRHRSTRFIAKKWNYDFSKNNQSQYFKINQ